MGLAKLTVGDNAQGAEGLGRKGTDSVKVDILSWWSFTLGLRIAV